MYRPFRPTAISGHTRLTSSHTRLTSGHTRLISGHKKTETYHAIPPTLIGPGWEAELKKWVDFRSVRRSGGSLKTFTLFAAS
jgi:hypothetical protein